MYISPFLLFLSFDLLQALSLLCQSLVDLPLPIFQQLRSCEKITAPTRLSKLLVAPTATDSTSYVTGWFTAVYADAEGNLITGQDGPFLDFQFDVSELVVPNYCTGLEQYFLSINDEWTSGESKDWEYGQ